MNNLSSRDLCTILDACEVEGTITSYSGRGMFGRECVGFETDENNLFHFGAEMESTAQTIGFECGLVAEINNIKIDNLGHGYIVYFPDFAWDPKWDEQDAEDEDTE